MSTGRGYGKVILFNEHFVVHGIPAIVCGIGDYTEAEVNSPKDPGYEHAGKGVVIQDDRPATPDYKKQKEDHQGESIRNILKAMDLDPGMDLSIKLGGPLYAASGVGASAASCAAIARALSEHFGMNLDDERINAIAFEGEKAYHGTPSGIDNSAATYGGLIWFEGTEAAPKLGRIDIKAPVEIVMGNTGIVADTKKAVADVKERRERYGEKYEVIFKAADKMARQALAALDSYDMTRVGELMNDNHRLLQAIEVSHPKLDLLVNVARGEGAPGAKLTGGGLGGYMIALTPGKKLQERVANAIEAEGCMAVRTTIG
jgi:mevalonate kinase